MSTIHFYDYGYIWQDLPKHVFIWESYDILLGQGATCWDLGIGPNWSSLIQGGNGGMNSLFDEGERM